jgi:NADH-quinone oxidoreductase subunit H
MISFFFNIIIIFIFILVSVAYFTLAERKILGVTQQRKGPNVIGFYGLLQPLADGLKLLTKEPIFPNNSDKLLFLIAPLLTFLISLLSWAVIPFSEKSFLVEFSLSSLYVLACSALGIYGILVSGWASNSKYAFLGAMRSAAQMISYELPIGIVLSILTTITGSFNLNSLIVIQKSIGFFFFTFPLLFLLFFICIVAETNRHPFDLPEAEAELVSGYNVEYAAMSFALFSLGEYGNILLMSSFTIVLFFGGWLSPFAYFWSGSFWFSLKILFFIVLFVLLRAGLPRYRYDQLMEIGWQILMPLSFSFLLINFILLSSFNLLPF